MVGIGYILAIIHRVRYTIPITVRGRDKRPGDYQGVGLGPMRHFEAMDTDGVSCTGDGVLNYDPLRCVGVVKVVLQPIGIVDFRYSPALYCGTRGGRNIEQER